jgi:hypothetical protein
MCFYPVFNLAHTLLNIQYVECGQYMEEEDITYSTHSTI